MAHDAREAGVPAPYETPASFGPQSVSWRVLTAPATALMIAQITNLLEIPHLDFQAVLFDHDPLFPTNKKRQRGPRGAGRRKDGHFHDRLRRTLSVPLPMVLGDQEAARSCATRLFNYHRPMTGVGADGQTPYAATSPESMLFAAVTISHAALIGYENFAFDSRPIPRRLNPAERDRYFAEMAQIAVLMGVPAEDVPMSAGAVDRYYRSIAAKFGFRPGWESARLRTAAALLVPDSWSDVTATVNDIALVISTLVAYAALPKPSRRLHRLAAITDPAMAVTRMAALPFFALLEIPPIARAVLRWYLGESDRLQLAQARRQIQLTAKATLRTAN
ncbi:MULTISPECIES: oxygenase MpaB family protein [Mycolicibacter]|uniref:ER-bound oxygenase mpaB/mpaB'/Rubber oxygenase catalytic domain-containing protein n=2 Tax=Mycolicibacter TaxID=1073531 RepID=A0A1X1T6I1_9MYCO|nr:MULTISPECIES: oxygenase MpaB family protein [Mycolicibacter]MCV7086857.1 DUF2236 domain-containing protein [Mycolicibacter hiberniae]ORV40137.1 hypothetical protein AWC02_19155 [Mycolicibacter engbaekii]ORV70895.1 hypothetical protein AWC09_08320 [Mycolicibacter hiberniae]BBZ21844.1 hypothetical protein MHIB_02620 [Mycolicibacter hiberniae]